MTDVWQIYNAESYSKVLNINNQVSQTNDSFAPMHFFFCDNGLFLPLVNLQYHEVEIRVIPGSSYSNASNVKAFANFIMLDTKERTTMATRTMDILITQVQRIHTNSDSEFDLSYLNHPVKSIYFGFPAENSDLALDKFSFDTADMYLNGNQKFEEMSPTYFHTVQGYYHTKFAALNFDNTHKCPLYTRYYTYNFGLNGTEYRPTGSCNFSRLDNAKIKLSGVTKGTNRTNEPIVVYGINYNILRIKEGMGGVMFSN
jgi:hypothetical protein